MAEWWGGGVAGSGVGGAVRLLGGGLSGSEGGWWRVWGDAGRERRGRS